VTPLALVLGLLGLAWGIVADRISTRWPAHEPDELPWSEADGAMGLVTGATGEARAAELEPGEPPRMPSGQQGGGPRRPVDWRTAAVALVGGGSFAGVALRFDEPLPAALFVAWAAVLVLLLGTDLDQRLLPDVLTLPLIPAAAVAGLAGWNPLVADGMLWPAVAAAAFPAGLYLLSKPFGPGAIGIGDLKLLVSVGLTLGLVRTFVGIAFGALLSAVVVLVLLGLRVIGPRSYIPYGPFLILGSLWVTLVGTTG
jgi:leader peptidase (prepilin peptidase)/N-methyltransferase